MNDVSMLPQTFKRLWALKHLWTCVSCCESDVKHRSVVMTSLTGSESVCSTHTLAYRTSPALSAHYSQTVYYGPVARYCTYCGSDVIIARQRGWGIFSVFCFCFFTLTLTNTHTHTFTDVTQPWPHRTSDSQPFHNVFTLIMKPVKHMMIDWFAADDTDHIYSAFSLIVFYEALKDKQTKTKKTDSRAEETDVLLCRQPGISCLCSPEEGIKF